VASIQTDAEGSTSRELSAAETYCISWATKLVSRMSFGVVTNGSRNETGLSPLPLGNAYPDYLVDLNARCSLEPTPRPRGAGCSDATTTASHWCGPADGQVGLRW